MSTPSLQAHPAETVRARSRRGPSPHLTHNLVPPCSSARSLPRLELHSAKQASSEFRNLVRSLDDLAALRHGLFSSCARCAVTVQRFSCAPASRAPMIMRRLLVSLSQPTPAHYPTSASPQSQATPIHFFHGLLVHTSSTSIHEGKCEKPWTPPCGLRQAYAHKASCAFEHGDSMRFSIDLNHLGFDESVTLEVGTLAVVLGLPVNDPDRNVTYRPLSVYARSDGQSEEYLYRAHLVTNPVTYRGTVLTTM